MYNFKGRETETQAELPSIDSLSKHPGARNSVQVTTWVAETQLLESLLVLPMYALAECWDQEKS